MIEINAPWWAWLGFTAWCVASTINTVLAIKLHYIKHRLRALRDALEAKK